MDPKSYPEANKHPTDNKIFQLYSFDVEDDWKTEILHKSILSRY